MNKKYDLFGILLSLVVGVATLTAMLLRAFWPQFILPRPDGMTVIALIVIALIINSYFGKDRKRVYWAVPIYSALVFGLFSWVSCLLPYLEAIKLGILGAVVSIIVTLLFDSMLTRISTGRATKIAPIIGGFGIYLAAQCLTAII